MAPADGRILPGVARDGLLGAGEVTETPIELEDLRRAGAVRLVSALPAVDASV